MRYHTCQVPRFHCEAHGFRTVPRLSHKISKLSWRLWQFSFLILVKVYFYVFQNKNSLNWLGSYDLYKSESSKSIIYLPWLASLGLANPPCINWTLAWLSWLTTKNINFHSRFWCTNTEVIKKSFIWTKHKKARSFQ